MSIFLFHAFLQQISSACYIFISLCFKGLAHIFLDVSFIVVSFIFKKILDPCSLISDLISSNPFSRLVGAWSSFAVCLSFPEDSPGALCVLVF